MKKSILFGLVSASILVSCGNNAQISSSGSGLSVSGEVPVGQQISEKYKPYEVNVETISHNISQMSALEVRNNSVPDAKTLAQPVPPVQIKYPEDTPKDIKGQQVDLGVAQHGVTGLTIISGKGIWEGHSAWSTMNLPNPTTPAGNRIYAPTTIPNGYSCLEVLSSYWNAPSQTSTVGQMWVWNHCNSSNHYIYNRSLSDASWTANYVRNSPSGVPRYYAGVYQSSSNNWTFILWNFSTGAWEYPITVSGQNPYPQSADGWSMWEAYFNRAAPPCPTYNQTVYAWTPNILRNTGVWSGLMDSDTRRLISYNDCAENGTYFHRIYNSGTTQIEHWEASNYQ